MPRFFQNRRQRYVYTLLMSAGMSLAMSYALGFIRLGVSWDTAHICLVSWPLAFVINYAVVSFMSPAMRWLTLKVCTDK